MDHYDLQVPAISAITIRNQVEKRHEPIAHPQVPHPATGRPGGQAGVFGHTIRRRRPLRRRHEASPRSSRHPRSVDGRRAIGRLPRLAQLPDLPALAL